MIRICGLVLSFALVGIGLTTAAFAQEEKKPNIVIIWGDDIGQSNVSAYTRGLMGYQTPNIDSIARDGMIFTDYYGEQSCTAGRASFITGQHGMRTGLTKVGMPGAKAGMQKEDPTIANLLKAQGYATAQIGKNHLGDRNEYLPTVHGFDEFYGNLYHLNAEEEPEHVDYPKDPEFRKKFGPRGVLECKASDTDDETEDTTTLPSDRLRTSRRRRLPANRSSCGSISPTCTHSRIRRRRASARRGSGKALITT
jgi:arylsulfatase A-like enzyme